MTEPPTPPKPSLPSEGDGNEPPNPLAWPRYITPPQQPPAEPDAAVPLRDDNTPPNPLAWPRYVTPPEQLPSSPDATAQHPVAPLPPTNDAPQPPPPPVPLGDASQPPPLPPSLLGDASQPPPPAANALPQPPPTAPFFGGLSQPPPPAANALPQPPPTAPFFGGVSQPPPPAANALPQPPPMAAHRPETSAGAVVTHSYDHERSLWGLGDVFASLAVYFVASIGIAVSLISLYGVDDFLLGPRLPIVVVGPHVALLFHAVWVSKSKGQGLAADFKVQFSGIDVAWAIALFVGGLVCAGVVGVVIAQLFDEQPTSAAVEVARDSSGDTVTVWIIVFAILVATFGPFVEEVVYRGLVWSALEKRGMQPWMILVITSALFAAIHLEFVRSPVLFVLGLALGMGRLLTGRIGAPILAHMIFNSLAMAATLAELS